MAWRSERNKHTIQELQEMQAMPLKAKVNRTKELIQQWVLAHGEDGVYVSFSGGKDSTVLLTIAREMYPNIKACFFDTGLEYPEIRDFVKTFDNVDWIKPKMTFKQVIDKYGYPFISKEVAECVWGARKYLTSILQSEMLDRPTDRPTDREVCLSHDEARSGSVRGGYNSNAIRSFNFNGRNSRAKESIAARHLDSDTEVRDRGETG